MADIGLEIAASLLVDEIPFKLRCASCDKLVVNAFRLPCCDQNVCQKCQESLPESCPVCTHSPLSAGDCNPNKSLRLTIKAFLKSEEKKRKREKTSLGSPNDSGLSANIANELQDQSKQECGITIVQHTGVQEGDDTHAAEAYANVEIESSPSSRSSSIEITLETPGHEERSGDGIGFGMQRHDAFPIARDRTIQGCNMQTAAGHDAVGALAQATNYNNPSQFTPNSIGFGFSGMDFSYMQSNMNPYSMMTNMQNFNVPMSWQGYSNVMGVPGMDVDLRFAPLGMYGGFNTPGAGLQGMNGLNMGMSFDGVYGTWGSHLVSGAKSGEIVDSRKNTGRYPTQGYKQQSQEKQFNQMHHAHSKMNNNTKDPTRQGFNSSTEQEATRPMRSLQMESNLRDYQSEAINLVAHNVPTDTLEPTHSPPKGENTPPERAHGITTNGTTGQEISGSDVNAIRVLEQGRKVKDLTFQADLNTKQGEFDAENDDSTFTTITDLADSTGTEPIEGHSLDAKEPSKILLTDSKPQPIPAIALSEQLQRTTSRSFLFQEHVDDQRHQEVSAPGRTRESTGALAATWGYDAGGSSREQTFQQGPRLVSVSDRDSVPFVKSPQPAFLHKRPGVEGAPTGPKALRNAMSHTSNRRGVIRAEMTSENNKAVVPKEPITAKLTSTENENIMQSAPHRIKHASEHVERRSRSRSQSHSRRRQRSLKIHSPSSKPANGNGDAAQERRNKDSRNHLSHANRYSDTSESMSRAKGLTYDFVPDETDIFQRDVHSYKNGQSRHGGENRKDYRPSSISPANWEPGTNTQPDLSESTGGYRQQRKRSRDPSEDLGNKRKHKHRRHERSESSPSESRQFEHSIEHREKSELKKQSRELEFKIKNLSKPAEPSTQNTLENGANTNIDPNTLEREARNRERLLKEQQRRDSLTASTSSKMQRSKMRTGITSSREVDRMGSKWKARHEQDKVVRDTRRSNRYNESEEDTETRTLRVEREREAARWA